MNDSSVDTFVKINLDISSALPLLPFGMEQLARKGADLRHSENTSTAIARDSWVSPRPGSLRESTWRDI